MDEKHKKFLMQIYELYNRFGIKSVTMDDVAHELGISKKTLYQSVRDKANLVEQVVMLVADEHNHRLNEIVSENLSAIEELFRVNQHMNHMISNQNPAMMHDLQKYYPEIHRRLLTKQRRRMHDAILKNLRKGIRQGIYRKDMNVDIISKIYLTRMEYHFNTDPYMTSDIDPRNLIREIFIYHMHGISNEKGVQELNKQIKNYFK